MKVLLLGGSGDVGRSTARILDEDPLVTGITIAARSREVAAEFAKTLSTQTNPVVVDATDDDSVADAASGHDLIVNAAGPDYLVMLPSLRAAIRNRINYCDVSADGPATQKALDLHGDARDAGITALVGIGIAPGVTNLFCLHASRQLDEPKEIDVAFTIPAGEFIVDPSTMLDEIRRGGRVSASLQTMIKWASSTVTTYDEGTWTSIPGFERSVEVPLWTGGTAPAYEIDSTEPITLPHELPGIRAVHTYMSLQPIALCDVIRKQGARVAEEGVSTRDATIALLQETERDPERLLAISDEVPPFGLFARASGLFNGRRAVAECAATSYWATTHGALAVAAKKLLSGELNERGVLSPESCLDPEPFFAEMLPYAEEAPPNGQPLRVSVEQLS